MKVEQIAQGEKDYKKKFMIQIMELDSKNYITFANLKKVLTPSSKIAPSILDSEFYNKSIKEISDNINEGIDLNIKNLLDDSEACKIKNEYLKPIFREIKAIIKYSSETEESNLFDMFQTVCKGLLKKNNYELNSTCIKILNQLEKDAKTLYLDILNKKSNTSNLIDTISRQLNYLSSLINLWKYYINIIYMPIGLIQQNLDPLKELHKHSKNYEEQKSGNPFTENIFNKMMDKSKTFESNDDLSVLKEKKQEKTTLRFSISRINEMFGKIDNGICDYQFSYINSFQGNQVVNPPNVVPFIPFDNTIKERSEIKQQSEIEKYFKYLNDDCKFVFAHTYEDLSDEEIVNLDDLTKDYKSNINEEEMNLADNSSRTYQDISIFKVDKNQLYQQSDKENQEFEIEGNIEEKSEYSDEDIYHKSLNKISPKEKDQDSLTNSKFTFDEMFSGREGLVKQRIKIDLLNRLDSSFDDRMQILNKNLHKEERIDYKNIEVR